MARIKQTPRKSFGGSNQLATKVPVIPFCQSYISVACADRQSSLCLASQYTRMFCETGWSHAPPLLSNGSLGCCPPQAWHRDGMRPCPLPPAWCYEESTSWHDENKVIVTQTPNVTISWTRMISHCCTMISLKHVHIFMHLQEKAA